jgi:hypothetical protein
VLNDALEQCENPGTVAVDYFGSDELYYFAGCDAISAIVCKQHADLIQPANLMEAEECS